MTSYQASGPVKVIREPNHYEADTNVDAQKSKLEALLRNNSEMKQKLKIKVVASRERLRNASIDVGDEYQRPPKPIVSKLN